MRTGLLYKITNDQIENFKPLYLFGTIHYGSSEIFYLSHETVKAFEASNTAAFEIFIDPVAMQEATASLISEWREIFQQGITAEQAIFVNDFLFDYYPESIATHSTQSLETMPPLQLTFMLILALYSLAGKEMLDLHLFKSAMHSGKSTHGLLDSKNEHYRYLMGFDLTLQEQLQIFNSLYNELIKNKSAVVKKYKLSFKNLIRHYLNGDTNKILNNARTLHGTSEAHMKHFNGILTIRDNLMASSMQKKFPAGGAFIAVGVAHLPGITAQLAEKGYRIEAIAEGPRFIHTSALHKPVNINSAILKFNKRFAVIATALTVISVGLLIAGAATGGAGLLIGAAAVFSAGLIAAAIFAGRCIALKTTFRRMESKKNLKQPNAPHLDKPALTVVHDRSAPQNSSTLRFGAIEGKVNQPKQGHCTLPDMEASPRVSNARAAL